MRYLFIGLSVVLFTGLQLVVGRLVRRYRKFGDDESQVVRKLEAEDGTREGWLWVVATSIVFLLLALLVNQIWEQRRTASRVLTASNQHQVSANY